LLRSIHVPTRSRFRTLQGSSSAAVIVSETRTNRSVFFRHPAISHPTITGASEKLM
jgi:hypothetical protein